MPVISCWRAQSFNAPSLVVSVEIWRPSLQKHLAMPALASLGQPSDNLDGPWDNLL
jgi:hypothetical protein